MPRSSVGCWAGMLGACKPCQTRISTVRSQPFSPAVGLKATVKPQEASSATWQLQAAAGRNRGQADTGLTLSWSMTRVRVSAFRSSSCRCLSATCRSSSFSSRCLSAMVSRSLHAPYPSSACLKAWLDSCLCTHLLHPDRPELCVPLWPAPSPRPHMRATKEQALLLASIPP